MTAGFWRREYCVALRAGWLVGGVMIRECGGRAAALYIGLGVERTFWNDLWNWRELLS